MKSVLVLVQKIIIPRVSLSFHPFHYRPWGQNKAAAMMRGPGTDADPVYNVSSVRSDPVYYVSSVRSQEKLKIRGDRPEDSDSS